VTELVDAVVALAALPVATRLAPVVVTRTPSASSSTVTDPS
jgi:hypothetical protein